MASKTEHGLEAFTESLLGAGESGSESLGSFEGEGVSTSGGRCRALLALVWHCPRPLWGGSWGSGSSTRWPLEGLGANHSFSSPAWMRV